MFNDLDLHADQGRNVARARNERDESRACFEEKHWERMLDMEQGVDKAHARVAFDMAYKDERTL